ncbi:MAG: hypothetical protein ACKVT0_20520 [Planctomycetaceae bacterium]
MLTPAQLFVVQQRSLLLSPNQRRACRIVLCLSIVAAVFQAFTASAQTIDPTAPFRDLNDEILGDAVILNGKQLFVDDYLIAEMAGTRKVLNQPVKQAENPLIVPDQPWEKVFNRGSVLYDRDERLFKMWYIVYSEDMQQQLLAYATSEDGIHWKKPAFGNGNASNVIPDFQAANPPCVIRDDVDTDPKRRYKMLFGEPAADQKNVWFTSVAFSPDGFRWMHDAHNPLIPHSDTLSCPFWDPQRNRYVAYVRYGPPNIRIVSRIESEDFVFWSPKVTVLRTSAIDAPFNTQFYGMNVLPYEGIYLGLITAYHGETIQPIPADQLWRDRKNVQLAFSRNGMTWNRVSADHLIDPHETHSNDEWKQLAESAVFIPYGKWKKSWDAGVIYPFHAPIVIDDEIFIYYYAHNGRNWWNYHGDTVNHGIGLAKLRLDGFVSIEADDVGTLTTKRLLFIGDTLVLNADATGGSIQVEALDSAGQAIPGFTKDDSIPLTGDSVRHVLQWQDQPHCQPLQARPVTLRFYMHKAKIYSLESRIRHKHLESGGK